MRIRLSLSSTTSLFLIIAALGTAISCSGESDLSTGGNGDSDGDADGDSDTDTDTDVDGDSDGDADTDTDTDADTDTSNPVDTDTRTWEEPVFSNTELPSGLPTINIQIDAAAMARLDANPYDAPDEIGAFTDGNGHTYTPVDVNYRGAYQLQTLMEYFNLRNWKIKFSDIDMYQGRREWNFNYEPHFRQKMALDLLRFAGVRVPSAQHVILQVNGQSKGMYLQFEDPDSKDWLWDMFGHDNGDLFKAAYDNPSLQTSEKCFADFTNLGSDFTSAANDYMCHFDKKTNHKIAPNDYSSIGQFIVALNSVSAGELEAWFAANFDVDSFISYLVIANFISNWDSYPVRPKNFWAYQNLRENKFVFIPWDLDNTFHSSTDMYNQMGAGASIFYELETHDYNEIHANEGTERPLARRLMDVPAYRQAYIDRYRELCATILNPTYLDNRLDALNAIVAGQISGTDATTLADENDGMSYFFTNRYTDVMGQLDALP